MSTISHPLRRGALSRLTAAFAGRPAQTERSLFDILLDWQERAAQRHALGRLEDRMLKDVGLTRAAAQAEAAKPFWRA